MLVAHVRGRVWNDRQVADLERRRLVLVRDFGSGAELIAVDLIDVSAGDTVLVATQEAAAAAARANAVDAAVVARVAGADVLPDGGGAVVAEPAR
jgi:ethanolamine utilization protein EutN